jgi:hypothetical protein
MTPHAWAHICAPASRCAPPPTGRNSGAMLKSVGSVLKRAWASGLEQGGRGVHSSARLSALHSRARVVKSPVEEVYRTGDSDMSSRVRIRPRGPRWAALLRNLGRTCYAVRVASLAPRLRPHLSAMDRAGQGSGPVPEGDQLAVREEQRHEAGRRPRQRSVRARPASSCPACRSGWSTQLAAGRSLWRHIQGLASPLRPPALSAGSAPPAAR